MFIVKSVEKGNPYSTYSNVCIHMVSVNLYTVTDL